MKYKYFLLIVAAIAIVAGVVIPRFNQSPLLDTASLQGTILFDDGTRIYMHTDEKLEQLPVVCVRTQPPQEGQIQIFDVSIYRNKEDVPQDGEILPCEEGEIGSAFAVHKIGTAFHFTILHSVVEGDKFDFIVNGKKLGLVEIGSKVVNEKSANDAPNEDESQQPTDTLPEEGQS